MATRSRAACSCRFPRLRQGLELRRARTTAFPIWRNPSRRSSSSPSTSGSAASPRPSMPRTARGRVVAPSPPAPPPSTRHRPRALPVRLRQARREGARVEAARARGSESRTGRSRACAPSCCARRCAPAGWKTADSSGYAAVTLLNWRRSDARRPLLPIGQPQTLRSRAVRPADALRAAARLCRGPSGAALPARTARWSCAPTTSPTACTFKAAGGEGCTTRTATAAW